VLSAVIAAISAAVALAWAAPLGAVLAPVALATLDVATVRGEADLPWWPLRFALRLLQTGVLLFAFTMAARLGIGADAIARARWALPLLAILLGFVSLGGAAWSAGAVAGLSERRPRIFLVEGALVAWLDLALVGWLTRLSLVTEHAPAGARWPVAASLSAALLARAVILASLSRRARTRPGAPTLAVLAFLAWLSAAAATSTLRGTPLTWAGLGAAMVLSAAAAIAQSRARAPSAPLALARATLACMVATYLAVLSAVSGVA
jgi:hypothetical protein